MIFSMIEYDLVPLLVDHPVTTCRTPRCLEAVLAWQVVKDGQQYG